MFGISMEELLLLAVLAFILFGPQKLPEYAEKVGRIIAKVRAASTEVSQQFQNPFQYPPEPDGTKAPRQEVDRITANQRLANFTVCPSCQQTIGRGFSFCPNCGQRLKKEEPPAPEPQQPQAS